ncbi:hypothetical protein ACHAW6_011451, partial [Cyclotella cf. meneghiniana]
LESPEKYDELPFKFTGRTTSRVNRNNAWSIFRMPKLIKDRQRKNDAIYFGIRMAVCLTVASLFVLAQLPTAKNKYPEGMWVVITVLFVCWFPQLDAASVLEKSFQRLVGTFIGTTAALACGFLSLSVARAHGFRAQAMCLTCCIALFTFVVCSYAVHTKIIETMSYGTILCLLTFIICLMPFYDVENGGKGWKESMYRVMNVIIGCVLGVGLSMSVFPRPTVCIIQHKVEKQIELAGKASRTVLLVAAEIFSETAYIPSSSFQRHSSYERLPSYRRHWRNTDPDLNQDDVILSKYEASMKEYREVKGHFGNLKYDPFNIGRPNNLLRAFKTEVDHILSRAMRMQTTIILIDGIIRSDPKHKFSEENLNLLVQLGNSIQSMLTVPLDISASDAASEQLCKDLVTLRSMILDLSAVVSKSRDVQIHRSMDSDPSFGSYSIYSDSSSVGELDDDRGDMHVPTHIAGSHVCSLLFLQLAEHLALRSLRLYQSYKQCEGVCLAAEDLRKSIRENHTVIPADDTRHNSSVTSRDNNICFSL